MNNYYKGIQGLGNVAFSRHALSQAKKLGINQKVLEYVLRYGFDVPDGIPVIWRQKNGIRLVILRRPKPFCGAKLVKTVYRIKPRKALK